MEEKKILHLSARYQHDYKWVLKFIIVIQLIIITMIAAFMYYRVTHLPQPKFFATTDLNQIIEPVPLDVPAMSSAALLNWVAEAITNSLSFNYTQIERHVADMQQYYNTLAFENYTNLMFTDPLFKDIVAQKVILYSVPTATPKLIDDTTVNGRHIWQFEVAMLMLMNYPKASKEQGITFNVYVFRVPETESPNGVIIYKLEKLSVST